MKRMLAIVLIIAVMCWGFAVADTLTTNGGQEID